MGQAVFSRAGRRDAKCNPHCVMGQAVFSRAGGRDIKRNPHCVMGQAVCSRAGGRDIKCNPHLCDGTSCVQSGGNWPRRRRWPAPAQVRVGRTLVGGSGRVGRDIKV